MDLRREFAPQQQDVANLQWLSTEIRIETEATAHLGSEACLHRQGQGQVQHPGLVQAQFLEEILALALSTQSKVSQALFSMELHYQSLDHFDCVTHLQVWVTIVVLKRRRASRLQVPTMAIHPYPSIRPLLRILLAQRLLCLTIATSEDHHHPSRLQILLLPSLPQILLRVSVKRTYELLD